ncbi:MAG: phosphoribosylamine--glycine ligase [Acidobacteria bacterium]|nr:phosphoribosylamine--glycine ligase [Acidobacteriota bacterium]
MKILVLGGGAREHALVWKLAGERGVSEVVCAPGNAGMARVARCLPLDLGRPEAALALADREAVDLTVVGPELPLTRGIADLFAANGRPIFGPSRLAAQIESSKVFTKQLLSECRVPTARCQVVHHARQALEVLASGTLGYPVVVKADGLAAGKGVVIAPERRDAEAAVRSMMEERRFGDAGAKVVIEEFLEGREASFFVMTDGRRIVPLVSAEDHKRAYDGDEGPNTGGMGAYAPSRLWDAAVEERVIHEIVRPVLDLLRARGREYRGVLYAGLMLTREGPKVLEFNARFGDPEAQVVLPMLDSDLLPVLWGAASGDLAGLRCAMRSDPHVGVVLASGGYPESYETGRPIQGIERAEEEPGVLVFHAGTRLDRGQVVTAGGRVLTVVASGSSYADARARAYRAVEHISFDGMHFRRDIAAKALQSESA